MAKSKTLANIHTRNYVAAVFEKRLREEGFTCPDDKLLCWYRVRNGVLLDTVVFCSQYTVIPVELWIYYEVAPFFTTPFYTRTVYNKSCFGDRDDCYRRTIPMEGDNINNADWLRTAVTFWCMHQIMAIVDYIPSRM